MSSEGKFKVPDYTVVVIYDNNNSDNPRMIENQPVDTITYILHQFSQFSNSEMNGIPLHISHFTNKGVKNNKYTACIPKNLNDHFSTEEGKAYLKSVELNVVRYNIRRNGKNQKIYGLFIPGPTEIISTIFTNLENGFIRPNSYKITRPPPDSKGNVRDYSIVTFDQNQKGVIPRQFVEKIKVLLEDTVVGDHTIRVKWLNRKVHEDISKGVNKEINRSTAVSMEM